MDPNKSNFYGSPRSREEFSTPARLSRVPSIRTPGLTAARGEQALMPPNSNSDSYLKSLSPSPLRSRVTPAERRLVSVVESARSNLSHDLFVVLLERVAVDLLAVKAGADQSLDMRVDRACLSLADVVERYEAREKTKINAAALHQPMMDADNALGVSLSHGQHQQRSTRPKSSTKEELRAEIARLKESSGQW